MTVPASNAVLIFTMASRVCRGITMPGCRTTPRTKYLLLVALRQDKRGVFRSGTWSDRMTSRAWRLSQRPTISHDALDFPARVRARRGDEDGANGCRQSAVRRPCGTGGVDDVGGVLRQEGVSLARAETIRMVRLRAGSELDGRAMRWPSIRMGGHP